MCQLPVPKRIPWMPPPASFAGLQHLNGCPARLFRGSAVCPASAWPDPWVGSTARLFPNLAPGLRPRTAPVKTARGDSAVRWPKPESSDCERFASEWYDLHKGLAHLGLRRSGKTYTHKWLAPLGLRPPGCSLLYTPRVDGIMGVCNSLPANTPAPAATKLIFRDAGSRGLAPPLCPRCSLCHAPAAPSCPLGAPVLAATQGGELVSACRTKACRPTSTATRRPSAGNPRPGPPHRSQRASPPLPARLRELISGDQKGPRSASCHQLGGGAGARFL